MNRLRSDANTYWGMTRRQLSWLSTRAIAVVLCLPVTAITADDTMLPLVAPVRTLGAPTDAPQNVMNVSPLAPASSEPAPLPGTRLPQYQLGHEHRELPTEEERSDPRLRLILALPDQPLLIEATITLDGEPFRMLREQRVQEAFEQAQQPRPQEPQENTSETDAAGDTGTEDAAKDEATSDSTDADTETDTTTDARTDGTDADADPPQGDSPDNAAEESDNDAEEEDGVDDAQDEAPDGDAGEEAEKPVTPPTVPPYSVANNVAERLRRHREATGRPPTLQEVRWILTNWVDGPELLMLNDGFQRFRANQRPVYLVLDRDRDGALSAEEIAEAKESMRECDLNRDDVIEYEEIGRVAADPRNQAAMSSGPGAILFQVPDAQSAQRVYRRMVEQYRDPTRTSASTVPRFDENADGQFDDDELAALHEAEPDLRITVAFDSRDPEQSSLQLTAVSQQFAEVAKSGRADASSLLLTVNGSPLEIAAVQSPSPDQVSIGAIVDGYPLLSQIDPTPDGRLTIRDRRQLVERLNDLDTNADGQITADEMRSTTRICFGRGPIVDNVLASLRNARTDVPSTVVTGPEWFVRMDRNRDGDVTRSEFPGNDEQFAALDADGDKLVSAAEAVAFESSSETSADE
ncbi:EF hand [Maioricimonas rarisocia]|uniref:EF hand n=1 Tax=Maioricimonas rarisocia TaxID=2528026 RepID=A0A517Z6E8_9PLAN|nr:EF-hand domain-containing protein [Maioricimonas rarisocia]QDU38070.1 EF hand [Maioricimonas rarisocia]